jgi:hypothetical protein
MPGLVSTGRVVGRTVVVLLALGAPIVALAEAVPSPDAHLGFRPGADGHLAGWDQVVTYFQAVDRASDRVVVRELGKTTEGRPFVVAIISSAETIGKLDHYRELQANLADPRRLADDAAARRAVTESKTVVAITCSIHSTETASTLMAMELLHELVTRDDPATREVLDGTILLLIPSVNPDGVDKVARWYERSKGHPWEGSGMPELYHKYAGHDTNRDWFMLNLAETRLVSRLFYRQWFPTILYDVHQMGSKGARLFVPPFHDPINPNLDPRMHQSIFLIGAHMAGDLAAAGKRGVLTNALYDNWWNGGNRTTPQRHNIVGVLTEAASVKLATPVFIEGDDLKGTGRGFRDHQPAVNFVDPWPGGWWRLRDVVDYELICARSLLTLAARYRDHFQAGLLGMARDAVKKGQTEPPDAWVVPLDQRDPGTAAKMVGILADTGVEVRRATAPFTAGGATFPAGSWVLPAAQPYRAHLKDMMERQVYPERLTAGGKAEPPYDVAGWTLPLQMGVQAVEVARPFPVEAEWVERVEPLRGAVEGPADAAWFMLRNQANDDFTLVDALLAAKVSVQYPLRPDAVDGLPEHSLWFQADAASRRVLDRVLPSVSSRVVADNVANMKSMKEAGEFVALSRRRVGVYQPWDPSMDEGWTRYVLESFRLPFSTVHDADVRVGRLKQRFDVLLFPAVGPKTLASGYSPGETEPAYTGGLGAEGAAALREFVADGGRIVCLDSACDYAIDILDLPVKSALKGLATSTFYAPGSILRATVVDPRAISTAGVSHEFPVYFDQSEAFDVTAGNEAVVKVRYAASKPLESGWLLGAEKIAGKAAVVELRGLRGRGEVILIGFRPQHRGQTHGTFRLLFNVLLMPGR